MRPHLGAVFQRRCNGSLDGKWIIAALLISMYLGCFALYISLASLSLQLQQYARSLLRDIKYLKQMEQATTDYILRLTTQQEQSLIRQNALVQNLMSQSEVVFHDLEIISQIEERTRSKTGPNNVSSFDWLNSVSDLSYDMEHARRRAVTIVQELWFFIHAQIEHLNRTLETKQVQGFHAFNFRQGGNEQEVRMREDADGIPQHVQKTWDLKEILQDSQRVQYIVGALHDNLKTYTAGEIPQDIQKTREVLWTPDATGVPQDIHKTPDVTGVLKDAKKTTGATGMPKDVQKILYVAGHSKDVQKTRDMTGILQDVEKARKETGISQEVQTTRDATGIPQDAPKTQYIKGISQQVQHTPHVSSSLKPAELSHRFRTNGKEADAVIDTSADNSDTSTELAEDDEESEPSTIDKKADDNVNSEINEVSRLKVQIQKKLQNFSRDLVGYRRALTDAFTNLRNVDYSENVRELMSSDLGSLVQRRLDFIQNPKNCRQAQAVTCEMKSCGFGCNFHHFIYCLITAYATNRTLVMRPSLSWTSLFHPPSRTCRGPAAATEDDDGTGQEHPEAAGDYRPYPESVVMLPIIEELENSNIGYLPLSVPRDLAPKIATFHGCPAAWWVGQVASYLFKPTPVLMAHIKVMRRKLGFRRPIVGVHVRRTDKLISEAAYHSLEEYMRHVEDYYDQLQRSDPDVARRVFLATDDQGLLPEAQQKYPNYTFVSDATASVFSLSDRDLIGAVKAIATDIYFLSRSDFLVCTFSSQVCRLAYELMQTLHGDASGYFRSLDDIYYFGGQLKHRVVAVESYQADPNSIGTLGVEKGDKIHIAGNHWNGFSRGFNERTFRDGLYPSYTVEDTLSVFPMPEYPGVH